MREMYIFLFASLLLNAVKGQSDSQISDVARQIWAADEYPLTKQNCDYDPSAAPLFNYVNEGHLTGTPSYYLFRRLFEIYNPILGQPEFCNPLASCQHTIDDFLDRVVASQPMQIAHAFLAEHGHASSNINQFKADLDNYWFTQYTRTSGLDSSGFEHVFLGEVRGSEVTGFHNWIVAYEEERDGYFDYDRLIEACNPNITTYSFWWEVGGSSYRKNIGGHWFCNTPEVEMALYTLCFLTKRNQDCRVDLLPGQTIIIKNYLWTGQGGDGNQVGTAYPQC